MISTLSVTSHLKQLKHGALTTNCFVRNKCDIKIFPCMLESLAGSARQEQQGAETADDYTTLLS